jgi:hypothetical protein
MATNSSEYELSLKTTLEAESALRLRETYTDAILAGRQVALVRPFH